MYAYQIFKTVANYTVIIFRRDGNRNQTIVRQVGFVAEWQAAEWAEAKINTL
jgi:hypothetical protein